MFTIDLNHIKAIENYNEDSENCFILKDCLLKKSITLCGFKNNKISSIDQKNQWIEDIIFFRDQCKIKKHYDINSIIEIKRKALEQEEIENRVKGGTSLNKKQMEELRKKFEKLQNLAAIVN